MVNSSGESNKDSNDEVLEEKLQKIGRNKLQIAHDILESIDDYIWAFDKDWTIIYTNKKNAADFGYKPEELVGKNFWETFPRFLGTEVENVFKDVMVTRQIRRFEWKTIYTNTGWREFTVFPSTEGITVYGVDITEQMVLQQQLEDYLSNLEKLVEERTKKIRESEQSYRELYESFGEAFIATDWEFTIIHWNKAAEELTKIKAQDVLGKKVYDVLPEMDNVDITPFYEELRKRKPVRFMMNAVSRETGRPAVYEVSTYPSTLGIIIIVEDKTVEEETKRLSAIGQTAGMVGHDIRNPLQSIVSSMFLIKTDLEALIPSPEKSDALNELESIQDQITYVNKIVSDLQDYSRPLTPEIVEVDLKQLIRSTLSTIIVPGNVEAMAFFDDNLPKITTDPTMLKRVLVNLVTNAVQAMPKGGKLTVHAELNLITSNIKISVKDTGVGIPKAVREKMFTPLITSKAKGQGLGLAVVKRLIDALSGSITFESEEGKGTKFTIELPIANKGIRNETFIKTG